MMDDSYDPNEFPRWAGSEAAGMEIIAEQVTACHERLEARHHPDSVSEDEAKLELHELAEHQILAEELAGAAETLRKAANKYLAEVEARMTGLFPSADIPEFTTAGGMRFKPVQKVRFPYKPGMSIADVEDWVREHYPDKVKSSVHYQSWQAILNEQIKLSETGRLPDELAGYVEVKPFTEISRKAVR